MNKFTQVLLFLCYPLLTQAENLFQQVTPEEEARIYLYNQPSIDRQIYYASRYRIVRVNTKLLETENSEFTINPFQDIQMDVVTLNVDNSGPYSVRWQGIWNEWQVVTGRRRPSADDPAGRALGKEEIRRALQFEIDLQSWHLNPNTGEAIASGNMPGKYNSLAEDDLEGIQRLGEFKSDAFKSARGRFFIFGSGSFVLTPLQYTPKYHLIYIPHPDRHQGFDTPHDRLSDENKRRLREQQAFINSLPPEAPEKRVLGDI
ncbi:hypothetical protein [Microbulbifer sp. Q7]|uniref:hypothetical protein n=1 Tax=Microbulbifer sp. Q7 TaxID=1785091 RepID=UPI00082FF5CD|nr:hypothetical protein [Microbulbifer sp. Q7]